MVTLVDRNSKLVFLQKLIYSPRVAMLHVITISLVSD